MIERALSEAIKRTSKSVLLLGPRQVGKSTLIQSLQPDLSVNFADEFEFLTHSSKPDELANLIALEKPKTVFIDEVQRLPRVLNTVQALIDRNKKLKFYLTGSSARKLRRGGANLLPGRVLNYQLGPLAACELNYKMETTRALSLGTLPELYLSKQPKEAQKIARSYAATYLKEEIKAESLTRNLESFARFLQEATLVVSQFVDFTKLGHKARISRHQVPRYFEILEDTLIGQRIFPFEPLAEKADLIRHPKFFLFDPGVYNGLLGNFTASLDRIGILSEQLVFSQLLHSAWAKDEDVQISSFRTRSGVEVDFILTLKNDSVGIEVKTTDDIGSEDTRGLLELKELHPSTRGLFIFHMGTKERKMGPVWSVPWQKGLKVLGL